MNEKSTIQRAPRKKYSPQFKDQALERTSKDGVRQAAKDLGLPEPMLYSGRAKQRQTGKPHEEHKLQQAELSRLKREVARLEDENSFLKKAAAYFAKEPK